MESKEDRLKKLEAGKEKLAAFRKRKAKKKKPDPQNIVSGTDNSSEDLQNYENGTGLCLPDLPDMKDVWSDEVPSKSTVFLEAKLAQAKHRIAELEEAMEGKQLALDAAIKKSETANLQSKCPAEATKIESSCVDESPELTEFESALAQRDALLSQLSATLFESLGNTELNATVQAQVEALAEHVYQLQAQLHQADKTLEEQFLLHNSSAKAVHDAKCQMIQLQEIITSKDQELALLTEQKNQAMHQEPLQIIQDDGLQTNRDNQILAGEASNLPYIQEVLSSKEQASTLRELDWVAREKEWMSREQEWALRDEQRASREQLLQMSIESQSAQIMALSTSLDTMKTEDRKLRATCAELEAQLKNSQSKAGDKLSHLELELQELRKAYESDQNQIQTLSQVRQELEEKVNSQNICLSQNKVLQEELDALSSKYTECLSLLRDSELAKCDLEEKLRLVNLSPTDVNAKTELDQLKLNYQDQSEKQIERLKNYVELENKYSVDTDALNNKINELQSILQKSEAALQDANDATEAERYIVAGLQKTLQEKNEKLDKQDLKLTQLEEAFRSLQSENRETQQVLNSKEDILASLTEQYKTAQDALEQEKCSYSEQIVVLQDELIAAKHIHGVEQSEQKYHNEQLEEQMETMNSEYESLEAKLKDLEHQLTVEQESKGEILDKMQKLEKEFETVTDEEYCILQTIQSLSNKLELFQEQCKISEIASNEISESEVNTETQNKLSEKWKSECDALIFKIDSLTRGLGQYKVQLEKSEATVNDLTEKLKHSEVMLSSTIMELNSVQQDNLSRAKETEIELERLQARSREAEELETKVAALKDLEQQLLERDKCQEELQSQLEDTVSHWQKLQRIVQEKEVDLQKSQEMLEEQQRICVTLRKTFDEEKEELKSEVNGLEGALHQERDERNRVDCELCDLRGKVNILEGELETLIDTKCSNMAVLSGTIAKLQKELIYAKGRSEMREAEILAVQQGIEEKVENLTIDITEKNTEIDNLKNKAQWKEEEVANLKTELYNLRDESVEQKAAVTQLENAVSSLETQLVQQISVLEGKDLNIKDLNSSNQSQNEKMQVLEAELDDLRKACVKISTSVDQDICGAEDLQAAFRKKDDDLAKLQSLVKQLEADLETERYNRKQVVEAVEKDCEETKAVYESTLAEKAALEKELLLMKHQACEVGNNHELLHAAHSELLLKLEEKGQSLQSLVHEKESVGAELAQTKQHLCQVEGNHKLLQEVHADLQAKHRDIESTVQDSENRKCELETELSQVKNQLSAAEANHTTLQNNCSEIQGKLDESEKSLQCVVTDKKCIELELYQIKQIHLELESKHDNLNVAHSELKEKLENKDQMLEAEAEEKNRLVVEIINLKDQLYDVEENSKIYQTSCSEMQAKLMDIENKFQAAHTDKESLEKELNKASQQLSEMQNKCHLLQDSLSEIQAGEGEKNEASEKLRQTLLEKEGIVSQLKEEKELLSSHLVEMTASYEQLKSSETSLKAAQEKLQVSDEKKGIEISELQNRLKNSEHTGGHLEGIVSSLSNELQQRDETLIEQASQIAKMIEEVEQKSAAFEELGKKCKCLQQQNDLLVSQADSCIKDNNEKQEHLKAQLEKIKQITAVKEEQLLTTEDLFSSQKRSHEETLQRLRKLELESCRVQSELSHYIDCAHEREAYLVDQAKLIDEKICELANVMNELGRKDAELSEIQEKHKSLMEEHAAALSLLESLQSAKETQQADILRLQVDLDNQETASTQYAVECKQLNERLTQMTQVLEGKDAVVFNLNHDIEMYQKEIDDLRSEVVQRDTTIAELQEDLNSAKSTVKRKHEEAEMLKSNFDSCMEDMQVKLTEQEAKTKRLQSQLAEEARNVHQGKDELKEVYEQQISQMEEKIIKCEQQNEQLEKDLEDECKRAASSKDLYEHQLAELELNLQTSNSDLIRYKDELSKVTSNHECAVAGLKRLHEIQSSELEDNCMALEKTVAEQKRQINEMQNKFNKERISLEQNFEIQISDIEEKRRITEHEVDRLKRHLEEMKSDHTREMQQLEKSYESRLFELEDKCCVATSERDRLRASLADQSGMNDSNIAVLESKLQEVEVLRRELELSNHALEDEVLSLKESAQQREEEMMAVLKNVADRHKEDTNDLNLELSRLNEQLLERSKQVEMLKADYEGKIQDLKLNNCKLKEKVKVLEMHAEHDQELQEGERIVDLGAERAELQNMVAAMSEEINSLRFQLSMQRQKERNEHLTCGVEICPPFPSTSEFTQDECFSPTNEKPILEGFVAEHSKQYETSPHSIDRTNSREPGFVEEHEEGFQPEIEDEQIMGTIQPLHTHPIQETVVDEGFQPEMSDIFVMEEPDGTEQDRWLPNLSVGMSPSCRNSNLLQFDYSIQQPDSHDGDSITSQSKKNLRIKNHSESTEHRSNNKFESIEGCTSEAKKFTSSELEKKVQAVRDELEEQYVGKLRKQEVELAHDFATKQENAQREMEQNYVQRVQAIKYEWEQKFTKALQKVRKEMEKKHKRDLKSFGRGTSSSRSTGTSPRATRAEVTSEDQEDLEETVEQLHKENQELAEVRDVLLQQIEISQARGLHTKVQHELQSFLTNRDAAPASPPSPTSSSTTTTPTRTAASPTPEEEAIEVKGTGADYIDADGQSEVSETSSARERFLEELEDIAQQSSQDLPLEWELTTTLMASAMIGAGDNEVEGSSNVESGPPEHRSIWEVFDGRCVRQDCQELDTLRIQYEHQVSSLQRQLEAERRSNQEQTHLKRQQYEQLVCDLREVLGQKHQATLDSALARLSHAHTGEIKRLQAEHQNDICLELTAMKLSLEQVYATKSEMEAQESKQRFDQRLEALNKQHKEELNRFSSAQANTETTASLTEQYNQLVKRISEDLEQQFLSGGPETKHNGIDGDSLEDIEDTGYPSSQEIHNLLQSQQAEIAALRDRLHSGKEKDGSGDNQEEGMDVAELEQQLADLHKQYQAQVEQIQSSIKARDEEQEKEFAAYKKQVEKQQEDLRSHYENKIQDMETSFETEISNMKEKYEVQISGFINSKLNEAAECDFSNESNQQKGGALPTALSTPQQREYIQKTMALTAISDNDSDVSADASSGAPPVDYPARLQVLEAELLDRDSQLNELGARLRRQESSASSETEKELIYLKAKVTQLQQEASTALTRCSELQTFLQQKNAEIEQLQMENKDLNVVLEVKDKKINQLEAEKAESEKLYRDLLERESPRSKGSHGRDMPSGSSVDDSFASARDSIHNTPRSYASDHLEFTSPRSDVGDDENKHHSHHNASNTHELNDSIPFANDSSDYSSRNGNNNNNNNNSNSAALELAVEDLKRKVEELDTHLASAKEREKLLKLQLEESEHHHDEAIEMLKQELEHERKIEVETLQSEFRVQLEVELKRQAAQLCPEGSPVSEAGMLSSSVQQVQMAGPQLDCFSANNNATPVEEPLLQQSITLSQTSERNSILEDDRVDPLLQTSAFEIQQAVQGAHDPLFSKAATAEGKDNDDLNDYMDGVRDTNKSENLSDDSKASSPMGVPSPVHSSTPMAKRAKAEPLTDIEKEMEALRQEYEAKFAQLKAERDAAEERYDRLMQGVQSGEYPELNQLMKDKYDEELELTKSLIQQDFDAQMKEEKKKFVEKHRKLMTDFMADREKEEEEANRKHTEELEHLRDNLNREFEEKLSAYEQENIRLSRDLDLLRDVCQEEREEETPGNDSALPDIEEITLNFQQQLQNMQQTVPLNSEQSDCRDTSTPVTRPESVETGVQYEYEESEEETEAERAPTRQLRSFADVVKSPSPASVQDMEFTIEQLTAQVERLTLQLAQQQQEGAKTPTRSPQHSPENDTLKEEDSALVAMLQSDLERISAERESVQRTNDRLLSLLSDSVKTYVGVEDTINRKLSMVVSGATPRPCAGETSVGGAGSRPTSRPGSVETVPQSGREDSPAIDRKGATPDPDTSQDSHHLEDTSILSNATDEGLEISHRLAESIFVGPDLDAEGEEILTDARSRLTTAVGQLLELMERSTVQLMEAKATQQELLDTLAARGQELESTTSRNTELDSQLAAEIQAKDYLGLELHKAEGLIAGYSAERESLESQVQNLEEQREALIVDLDATRSRLDEFQRSQTEMESLRQDLGRQQELLRDNAGQEMQGALRGGGHRRRRRQRQSSSSPSSSQPSSTLSSSSSHFISFARYGFIMIPIGVFLGAYLFRRWWLRPE